MEYICNYMTQGLGMGICQHVASQALSVQAIDGSWWFVRICEECHEKLATAQHELLTYRDTRE